jgi:hypothetical protein
MNAIRIHTQVDSETLHLPQIRPLIGKKVEIIVLEESPLKPAPDGDEQSAARGRYEDFLALAGQDVIDPNALSDLRSASML